MTGLDKKTIKQLAQEVSEDGTRIAVVAGPAPRISLLLAQVGMKVFCAGIPLPVLPWFCKTCQTVLYREIFPITGDIDEIPKAFPPNLMDIVFVHRRDKFPAHKWLNLVRSGGMLAGHNFGLRTIKSSLAGLAPEHARDIWWERTPPDGRTIDRCAWAMMSDSGANYLGTLANNASLALR